MVWHRLVEDRAAGPGAGSEDEMAQRLDEGPFVIDSGGEQVRVAARRGRRCPATGARPCPTSDGPSACSQRHASGVPQLELALRECRDVDVVDDEAAHKPGHADIDQPRIRDRDLAQVTVPEVRAGEVRVRETGTAKCAGAVKSTLLFFDKITLALPEASVDETFNSDPELASPLADKGLLINIDPSDVLDPETARTELIMS